MQLNSTHPEMIVTANNRSAPPWKRILAFFIDFILVNILLVGFLFISIFILLFVLGMIFISEGGSTAESIPFSAESLPALLWFFTLWFIVLFFVLTPVLIIFLYFFISQYKFSKTFGQKICGLTIQSLNDQKQRLNLSQTFIRFIFFLPFEISIFIPAAFSLFKYSVPKLELLQFMALGVIVVNAGWYFFNPSKQTIHDQLSHTKVVKS